MPGKSGGSMEDAAIEKKETTETHFLAGYDR